MNKNTRRLIIAIIALLFLYAATSFSANLSMRRVIFLHGHPIQAFTADIGKSYHDDKRLGACYALNESKSQKFFDNPSSVTGVCLKKNRIGMYYKGSIGLF